MTDFERTYSPMSSYPQYTENESRGQLLLLIDWLISDFILSTFSIPVSRFDDLLMSSCVDLRIISIFESRLSLCRIYRQCSKVEFFFFGT